MPQWIHRFGLGMAAVGDRDPAVVGLKGASLATASRAGLCVPAGFTVSTAACRAFHQNERVLPTEISAAIESAIRSIEAATGRSFGRGPDRLTLAVRSSPSGGGSGPTPMPGPMGTVIDIGLAFDGSDPAREARARASFLQHVCDVDPMEIEEAMEADDPNRALATLGREIDAPDPAKIAPATLLHDVLRKGFADWENVRTRAYRLAHDPDGEWSMALVVQAMIESVEPRIVMFGAARTRNAETGENGVRGFFVRGNRSVRDVADGELGRLAVREEASEDVETLEQSDPKLFKRIETACRTLERNERDPVDVKFAVGGGAKQRVWVILTSLAPLSARGSIRVAVEMVREKLIEPSDAVLRVAPEAVERVIHARVDPSARRRPIGKGVSASPGAATGLLVFTAEGAVEARRAGRGAVFVCSETGPEDIIGIQAADAVVTTRGGRTSHAAVVARGLGRPCVTGAANLRVDSKNQWLYAGDWKFGPEDTVTVDGNTGEVLAGIVPLTPPALTDEFATLMEWADNFRRLRIRANADTPGDAHAAKRFGAEGIGLARTEHMFFDTHRMEPMREMILAESAEARQDAIDRMLPLQRRDFTELFKIMRGLPVMIRLLDPPLHEFLPKTVAEMNRAAKLMEIEPADMRARIDALRETNPMLGHRGCRLAISYPEIARMQIRAVLEAAGEVEAEIERPVEPEIMVPLVGLLDELSFVRTLTEDVAREVHEATGRAVRYRIGTMIELPRAALRADAIATEAEFFSFGTNDLTQTTFGISRDDASPFLGRYREVGIMENDPFATIDRRGVGELIRMACEKGRATRPDISLSICGEHGGDPDSIAFCDEIGLDYVSCSPYRVPVARLAAAQAAIRAG